MKLCRLLFVEECVLAIMVEENVFGKILESVKRTWRESFLHRNWKEIIDRIVEDSLRALHMQIKRAVTCHYSERMGKISSFILPRFSSTEPGQELYLKNRLCPSGYKKQKLKKTKGHVGLETKKAGNRQIYYDA